MVRRWITAGVFEVAKRFRRVKGCKDMPQLVEALKVRDVQFKLGASSGMVA